MKKALVYILYAAAIGSLVLFGFQVYGWFADSDLSQTMKTIRQYVDTFIRVAAILMILFQVVSGRQPTKSYAWILLLLFIPNVGVILYLMFGWNYGKERRFGNKTTDDLKTCDELHNQQLLKTDEEEAVIENEEIPWLVRKNLRLLRESDKALFYKENQLKVYHFGKELFADMIEDIRGAKHHIHCEYFIWMHGKLGEELLEVMAERAAAGVEVRVSYDSIGNRGVEKKFLKKMRKKGIDVRSFLPVKFPNFNSRWNYRNHRKITVIDGTIGYTGGFNVDDKYRDGDPELGIWRDTQLRIEGDAVRGLQMLFLTDWRFDYDDELDLCNPRYFPDTTPGSIAHTQIVAGGPDTDINGIEHTLLNVIGTAKEYLYITTPYLVPPQDFVETLKIAGRSGIDVRIIVPRKGDFKIVELCTQAYVQELLEMGIRIYFYEPGFMHAKLAIVDDCFASVGSANLDVRSLEQNFEVNTLLYDDHPIIPELKRQFFKDLAESTEINLEEWKERGTKRKILEGAARLLGPLF